MGEPIPFTLLGGYLGAGKTTILNHVLSRADGRRLAVLVNDVGVVNVDAALVADHDGDTLSLTNGCVCCGIEDDIVLTLERVRSMSPSPDHVVMELSGVAQPARVAPWANTTGFRLDGVIVAADADQIADLAARRFVGDTIDAQLAAADLVLLTKTDLADDAGTAAHAFLASRTTAPVIEAVGGAVDVDVVLGIGSDGPSAAASPDSRHTADLVEIGELSQAELAALVDGLPADVVRAKALVRCSDSDAPVEVQVVGRRRTIRRRPDLEAARARQAIVTITPNP